MPAKNPFAEAASKAVSDTKSGKNSGKQNSDPFTQRLNRLEKSQSAVLAKQYYVDPSKCRIWVDHNREYSALNEERCQSLIDSLVAEGRQNIPAIVREVRDDSGFDYEVIAGARRHWAVNYLRNNNYPDFEYFIEVRKLTDEEAFRLSDLENREREDISDYERAVEYRNALKRHYRTQSDMAARLNVKDAWLSKYLRLADLPKLIVAAFPDLLSIKTNYAAVLLPLLKEAKSKKRVLEVARNFTRKKTAGEQYSVADLMKAFKGSAVKSGRSGSVQRYQARNKSHPVLLKSATSRRLSIEIDRSAGVGRKEIVELLDKALKDHF